MDRTGIYKSVHNSWICVYLFLLQLVRIGVNRIGLLGKTKAELARYATVLRGSELNSAELNDDFEPAVIREKSEKQEEEYTGTMVCSVCKKEIPSGIMKQNLCVCPECGAHNKISAAQYAIGEASNIAQLALSYYYDDGALYR